MPQGSQITANYDATGKQIIDEDNSYLRQGLITASRNTLPSRDNGRILANNTANAYAITVLANTTPDGFIYQQLSTGTASVVAGAGVTFIGAALITAGAGQMISLLPTPINNTFIVKVA